MTVMTQEQMEKRRRQLAVFDGDLDRARSGYRVGDGWASILDDLVTDFGDVIRQFEHILFQILTALVKIVEGHVIKVHYGAFQKY